MTTLTFGSLFAGIGGFDLGFERAGMVCKWQVEIDDYCQRVLAKHWPEVKRYGDIKKVHGAVAHTEHARWNEAKRQRETKKMEQRERREKKQESIEQSARGSTRRSLYQPSCPACLPPVDVICGGFPCQPHSYAGKRKGAADDRDLWPEYFRLIKELRPRWVVGENVPGIRTTILDQVLSDLEGEAYAVTTLNLPACGFNAPHRRERLFIIAHAERFSRSENQPSPKSGRPNPGQLGGRGNVAHTNKLDGRAGAGGQNGQEVNARNWWAAQSRMGRVAHGVPARTHRLKSLGNAVVPQVAEFIGRRIVEVDKWTHA